MMPQMCFSLKEVGSLGQVDFSPCLNLGETNFVSKMMPAKNPRSGWSRVALSIWPCHQQGWEGYP